MLFFFKEGLKTANSHIEIEQFDDVANFWCNGFTFYIYFFFYYFALLYPLLCLLLNMLIKMKYLGKHLDEIYWQWCHLSAVNLKGLYSCLALGAYRAISKYKMVLWYQPLQGLLIL